MFATAQIAEPQTQDAVFVPEVALQEINGMQVVFMTQDGTTFRAQIVTVGTRAAGRAEIVDGLRRGDRIVAAGAFVVKSAMLKGTMGEG
jgi:multidrug efflux pump subunit AcrA (membrane-fusion protein)